MIKGGEIYSAEARAYELELLRCCEETKGRRGRRRECLRSAHRLMRSRTAGQLWGWPRQRFGHHFFRTLVVQPTADSPTRVSEGASTEQEKRREERIRRKERLKKGRHKERSKEVEETKRNCESRERKCHQQAAPLRVLEQANLSFRSMMFTDT